MQPPVSVQSISVPHIQRVSPPWLRPVAFGVVLGLHLVLLVGIPWPAATDIARPPPFEVQVIPQAEPAQLLVPLDSTAVAEVKPANAAPRTGRPPRPSALFAMPDVFMTYRSKFQKLTR